MTGLMSAVPAGAGCSSRELQLSNKVSRAGAVAKRPDLMEWADEFERLVTWGEPATEVEGFRPSSGSSTASEEAEKALRLLLPPSLGVVSVFGKSQDQDWVAGTSGRGGGHTDGFQPPEARFAGLTL